MSIEPVRHSARPVQQPTPPPKVDRHRDDQKRADELKAQRHDSDKAAERKRSERMVDIRA